MLQIAQYETIAPEGKNLLLVSQKAQYEMVGAALFEANQLKPRKKNNNKTVLN